MPGNTVKFTGSPEGLYKCYVTQGYLDNLNKEVCHLVETVEENRKGYSERQFKRAKAARTLYHNVGAPSMESFKMMLKTGMIYNCPVSREDAEIAEIAEKIFGPSMSSLKGKSTRPKPKVVREDLIKVPRELKKQHRNIELCMDTMFINNCAMLTAIDRTIKFRSLVPVPNRTHEEYFKAIDAILRCYNEEE